jgi:hypothetical protein
MELDFIPQEPKDQRSDDTAYNNTAARYGGHHPRQLPG